MKVTELVQAAFEQASSKYHDLHSTWITASVQIGSKLPNSLLMSSVQKAGTLDILIRCMEDELSLEAPDLPFTNQVFLSELWIGHVYEFVRLLNERKLAPEHSDFMPLYRDLSLVRIPLEKHEIAKDRQIREPLKMVKHPPNNDATDIYDYSHGDQTRSHIMRFGPSERGSLAWEGIDVTFSPPQAHWIERRNLSDRILTIWGT